MSSSAMRSGLDATYARRSEKILWRAADDCVVLFHEDDGRAFALSRSASAAWRMLDGSRSIADVARGLAACGPAEEARVLSDIVALIDDLERRGCVVVDGESPDAPRPADGPGLDAWQAPVVEEIVFGACDCSSGGRGVMRNAECVPKDLKQQTSTI